MYKDIARRNSGRLPIVVIEKDVNDRMASTVRHNRARGKHSVDGMTNIIYNMIKMESRMQSFVRSLAWNH